MQHNHWPHCKLQANSAKMATGQAEQDPDLPRSASNVLSKVQSPLCSTECRGKWKCRQVKFRGSLPRSENNVSQPMLHHVYYRPDHTFKQGVTNLSPALQCLVRKAYTSHYWLLFDIGYGMCYQIQTFDVKSTLSVNGDMSDTY